MANRRRGQIENRRHMARLERERLQTRYITIISVGIVALVLILIIYGIVVSRIIQPRQPVAIVNGEEISTGEFQAIVRYQRGQLVERWYGLAELMIQFGATDESTQSFFVSQMNQIEFELDATTVGRSVLNDLVDDRIIRAEAAKLGITVTEEEIDAAIEEFFQYYGGSPPPTATIAPTPLPTSTLTPLQMTLTAPTPTPTLTITQTAALTATATVTATGSITDTGTITETGQITDTGEISPTGTLTPEVTATSVVTITATPLPTATPYTFDLYQENLVNFFDSWEQFGFTEQRFRYLIESQIYRRKLLEEITKDLSRNQDQVWARHILVASEAEALEVIARLNAGEDFASLAIALSTDTTSGAKGGDLGWFGVGAMVPEFQSVAFNLDIGQVSDPVESQFGWHIIQVLGHEERPLSDDEFSQLKETNFEEWLSRLRLQADIQTFDYWEDRVPDEPNIPPGGINSIPGLAP
jgi:parvulin-like peptidyl-prolyl isomerase